MKAMAITQFGRPLEMIDKDDPVAGHGEVVLSVRACAICATDIKFIGGHVPKGMKDVLPAIPGHEIVGEVSSIGPGVDGWEVGDRGIVYVYVGCGFCVHCRSGNERLCSNLRYHIGLGFDGGFAEKIRVPANILVRISDALEDQSAVVITDAVTTSLHAVTDRAQVGPGDGVLIIGVGGIGIHVLQIVLLCGGYAVAVDIRDSKLRKALELGAHEVYNLEGTRDLPLSVPINKIIDTTGCVTDWDWLYRKIVPGGAIVLVGYTDGQSLNIGVPQLIKNELEVKASRGGSLANVYRAIGMVERGLVKPVIASVSRLEEANEVIDRMRSNDAGAGRNVLIP